MILISLIIAFVVLVIGSITDLQKREVHDYISYGLIVVAFATSIIYTILYWNYGYIASAAMGFIIAWIIAYVMFYLGQWGGGDSKLIMGLGTIIGFNVFSIFGDTNYWFIIFLLGIIFVGAIYGLFWSLYLAIKNRKEFMKSVKIWSEKKQLVIIRRALLFVVLLCVILVVFVIKDNFKIVLLTFIALLYVMFYVWLFVKIIEESCMIKNIPISKLTEGDWIYKNVYIDKKLITGPRDLGISKEQIATLKKYEKKGIIKKIAVKEGIPFIPAFLLAFIILLIIYYTHLSLGNLLFF